MKYLFLYIVMMNTVCLTYSQDDPQGKEIRHVAPRIPIIDDLELAESCKTAASKEKIILMIQKTENLNTTWNQDDDLLSFASGHHTPQEITDQITNALKDNIERAEKINQRQAERHAVGGYYTSGYHLRCTNFHLGQKQMELRRWQLKIVQDAKKHGEIAKEIIEIYDQQLDVATKLVQSAEDGRKVFVIPPFEYIDCETLLDEIRLERLAFLSANQTTDVSQDQVLQLLESNVAKAENLVKEFEEQKVPQTRPTWKNFCVHYAEFYLHQKQLELLRWQYENAEDHAARQTMAENILTVYEKQLDTAQKLINLAEESFRQIEMTLDVLLFCKKQHDRVGFEFMGFKLATQAEEKEALIAQMTDMLQANVKKAQDFYEFYEIPFPEKSTGTSPKRPTTLGLFQTKFYFHQKQVELLRWQYENTNEASERDELAEKLMETYKEQWQVAKKMAVAAGEARDVGIYTMMDYLDCENMFDQTTLDMLYFMLDRAERQQQIHR